MPFCQAIYKGIEGSEWEELYFHHREMSKAAGAKKPSQSQKAKALWAMKAANDREEEYQIQIAKKTFWEENRQDKICEKSTSKTQSWRWTKL